MCQLLGMSCNVPTDICFSFSGFAARGGGTDVHADGWGIAFFRKATTGQVALENCHPFRRELWGRSWAFAHNGHLEGFRPPRTFFFRPVGETDGEHLFARCATRLSYLVSQAPFGQAHLVDEDVSVDFAACTGPRDRVAVIATDPLTRDEAWTALAPGELVVFRDGEPLPESGAPRAA